MIEKNLGDHHYSNTNSDALEKWAVSFRLPCPWHRFAPPPPPPQGRRGPAITSAGLGSGARGGPGRRYWRNVRCLRDNKAGPTTGSWRYRRSSSMRAPVTACEEAKQIRLRRVGSRARAQAHTHRDTQTHQLPPPCANRHLFRQAGVAFRNIFSAGTAAASVGIFVGSLVAKFGCVGEFQPPPPPPLFC